MIDRSLMKLGKKAPRHDPRTLLMASYVDLAKLPPIPPARAWSKKADPSFGAMRNDEIGDCAEAAPGHMIQVMTANAGREITISDADVVKAYSEITGYDPSDPMTDQGSVELDVLNHWRKVGIGGHKIDAFVACEPKNHAHLRAAIDLFGAAYIGLSLPLSAQRQRAWCVIPGYAHEGSPGNAGSWGGHAVCLVDYDQHSYTCVTWGKLVKMTNLFVDVYCEESWAAISKQDWIGVDGEAPSGFDLVALEADLHALGKAPSHVAVASLFDHSENGAAS